MGCTYLRHGTPGELSLVVDQLYVALSKVADQFDSILVTGLSGTVPGSILAYRLNKNLVVVRKDSESSHGQSVEGTLAGRHIIIDDFVSSGATINRLLRHERIRNRVPVYVVLYRPDCNLTITDLPLYGREDARPFTLTETEHKYLFRLTYD